MMTHMQSNAISNQGSSAAKTSTELTPTKSFRTPAQPLDVINVPGALLKLQTLAAISGQSIPTLYRAAAAGKLALVKRGARCTRVTSEGARAYLDLLAGGKA